MECSLKMISQSKATAKPRPKPEKIFFEVIRGGLVPADKYAESQLRDKKFKIGDIVGAVIRKLRNPKFNRLVHKLGLLCAQNIEEFSGMDGHAVIKRLQLEGNICCDEIAIKIHGFEFQVWKYVRPVVEPILALIGFRINDDGFMIARIPRSLSFESLDEAEFHDAAKQICRWIADKYWCDLSAEKIEEMAQLMVDE